MHELQCAAHESFVFEVNASCSGKFKENRSGFFCILRQQKFRDCTLGPWFTTGNRSLRTAHIECFRCL